MALHRACNRCGAPVEKPFDPVPRLAVVPASSPSTLPVVTDGDFQVGIVTGEDADHSPIDYCAPCLISVVIARVMPTAAVKTATKAMETITAHRDVVASGEAEPA